VNAREVEEQPLEATDAARLPSRCDVVVVGAGPYGLAVAARLRAANGLGVRIFGKPMSFWESMPRGMLLRSTWDACHIGFPAGDLTLDRYKAESGGDFGKPVPLDAFVEYGHWFQREAVPDVDPRRVVSVARNGDGFEVRLEDGEVVRARRVVVAAGIESFASRPAAFAGLPAELVSHSSEHLSFDRFAGTRVAVVGGGQSALESAALLHEIGAEVEVIARTSQIIWLRGGTIQRRLGKWKPLLYAQTDVGPALLSRLVALPKVFTRLPRRLQAKLAYRAIRPAGARWLVARLENVPLTTGRTVVAAEAAGDRVRLTLDDGETREVDHVVLGTGYRVDVEEYDFLDPALVTQIRRVGGYPILRRGLESSVPGLHFVGAPAAWSYGPIMRFVSGSWYASKLLARSIRGT
jgi:cation diffusion facilitator CzcD-associated flavoprotein CzcO